MALRLLVFGSLAWLLPALLAGALGWHGVWGSGSALTDYLIPAPVAGGVLHVPSFVLLLLAVRLAPRWSALAAGRARAFALGAALTAALTLAPPPAWRLSANPLALFVLTDALVALLALAGAPRLPGLRVERGAVLALAAVPAMAALLLWQTLGLGEEFRDGAAYASPDNASSTVAVEVRGDLAQPKVRERALAWARERHDPRRIVNVEVVGSRFVPRDGGAPPALLCQYEDGTAPRWLAGDGDCLAGVTTFAARLARHAAALPADTTREVRDYLAARGACTEVAWQAGSAAASPMALSAYAACHNLALWRQQLAAKFPALP